MPVDIGLAGFPFEPDLISRASQLEFDDGVIVPTISAEDLIVMKAIANCGHDWGDIEGIIVRQGENLDWKFVLRVLSSLADLIPEHDPMTQVTEMRDRLRGEK